MHACTTTLQKSLADDGYYQGKVDDVYGPATVDAVVALRRPRPAVTGTMDKARQTQPLGPDLPGPGQDGRRAGRRIDNDDPATSKNSPDTGPPGRRGELPP